MPRRLGFGILFALVAFIVAAVAGYFLVSAFSSNVHDRSVEAAMTSVFFFGPVAGVLGFIGGFIYGGRQGISPRETA